MNKPNRAQILDDTRENFGLMAYNGYNPDTIKKMVFDMYTKTGNSTRSILREGRKKAVAIYTLEEINKAIDEEEKGE